MIDVQAAEVRVPEEAHHVSQFSGYEQGSIVSVVIGFVGFILWLRRKWSKDSKHIAQDEAETKFIAALQNRLDQAQKAADTAWTERNAVVRELGGMVASNEAKDALIIRLEARIAVLEARGRTGPNQIIKHDGTDHV